MAHEPMSDERLLELRAHRDDAQYAAANSDDMENDDPVILWQQFAADLTDAVAEIERMWTVGDELSRDYGRFHQDMSNEIRHRQTEIDFLRSLLPKGRESLSIEGGWECPKCGLSNARHQPDCEKCGFRPSRRARWFAPRVGPCSDEGGQ